MDKEEIEENRENKKGLLKYFLDSRFFIEDVEEAERVHGTLIQYGGEYLDELKKDPDYDGCGNCMRGDILPYHAIKVIQDVWCSWYNGKDISDEDKLKYSIAREMSAELFDFC